MVKYIGWNISIRMARDLNEMLLGKQGWKFEYLLSVIARAGLDALPIIPIYKSPWNYPEAEVATATLGRVESNHHSSG